MRTEKQIEASRRNGAKSNGPITEEGKAISSRNGTIHGLSGDRKFLYSNERDDLYRELLAHYTSLFQPANGVEEDLVDQIVSASWRMKRIDGIEASTVDIQMERQRKHVDREYKDLDEDTRHALAFQTQTVSTSIALWGRYHARALRSYNTAYRILKELQRARIKGESVQPDAPQPAVPAPLETPLPQLPGEPKNQPTQPLPPPYESAFRLLPDMEHVTHLSPMKPLGNKDAPQDTCYRDIDERCIDN